MALLKQLSFKNFKSWESLDLELAPVTGLFGTNSSGKSSIIQFLLMLKHTKNATDNKLVIDFGGKDKLVNLGSYKDIVHNHDESWHISWELQWRLDCLFGLENPTKLGSKQVITIITSDELLLRTAVSQNKKRLLKAEYIEYEIKGRKFALRPRKDTDSEFELLPSNDEPDANGFFFIRKQRKITDLPLPGPIKMPGPIKTYRFPDQTQTYYENSGFLSSFESFYENLMDGIFYLGPLREYPGREYIWSGAAPTDVGLRGENFVAAILAATQQGEKRQTKKDTPYQSFQEVLAWWLKEIGLISNFEVTEIAPGSNLYQVYVQVTPEAPKVLMTHVGFGVSQFLPILVLLYYVPEHSIILLEQPEIHLHPSIQSELADAILSIAELRNLQVIVESHSEYFLRRLQRRVAERAISPDFVKLYFCKMQAGQSVLEPLQMDPYGHIINWPDNFFGDSFGEIFAMEDAALQRKITDQS